MFTRIFTRIVVGLDGSEHARKALAIAIGVAKNDKADLLLVHALSYEPLSEGERKLAETEFGIKGLEVRTAASALTGANTDPRPSFPAVPEEDRNAALRARTEMAQAFLDGARQDAILAGVAKVDTRIEFGDPAKVILDAAKSEKADLIVLGSRGLSDIQGLMFGSTSHKVTHLASCSCVTVT
jgi:nucleotide-binding universal stress UspA family protein